MFRLYIRALLFLFPERGRHMISVCCNIRCINLMYTRNTSITCVPILQITYGMSCTTNPFNPSQSALRRLRGCFHKKVGYGASGYGVCLWNNYGTIQKVQLKNVHRSVMFCIIEGLRRSITKKHHRAVNVFTTDPSVSSCNCFTNKLRSQRQHIILVSSQNSLWAVETHSEKG